MGKKIYGLIGRTLKHSYSVPLHRELGNSAYRLFELEPSELAGFLGRSDLGGVNVTILTRAVQVLRHPLSRS